jgi:hypothetical protein
MGVIRLLLVSDSALGFGEIRTAMGISTNAIIILIAWMIMAVATIYNLSFRNNTGKFLLLFFTFMLVLLQERTIWVILAVYLLYLAKNHKKSFFRRFVSIGTLLLLIGGLLYVFDLFHFRSLTHSISHAFVTMFDQSGTLSWRLEGWILLLKNLPWKNYFLGLPFGSGYERIINGNLVLFNPHNYYVTHILRIGVIGMLMYLISLILVLKKSVINKQEASTKFYKSINEIIILSIIANLLGSITYSLSPLGGALWGIALSVSYLQNKTITTIIQKNQPVINTIPKNTASS